MAAEVVCRPEVRLGSCPLDHGAMFRRFGERGEVWMCGRCGQVTQYDEQQHAVEERAGAANAAA